MNTHRSGQPNEQHDLGPWQQPWLAEVYESNYERVFRLCFLILRNPEDAADASQEVFLSAVDSLNPTAPSASVTAWLLKVARHRCLDLLRRRKRLGKALVTLGSEPSASADLETAIADRDFVRDVFRHLSPRERQVLWQSAVENRPLADIAGRLRLSYMAAAQVVHRARLHASQIAARGAVIFGLLQLGRIRRFGSMLPAQRLAAVATVPLIVVALGTSSSTSPSVPPPIVGGYSGRHASIGTIGRISGTPSLPANATNASPTNTNPAGVGDLLGSVPGAPGTVFRSSAVPSLPPIAITTPSTTAIPIPTPPAIP